MTTNLREAREANECLRQMAKQDKTARRFRGNVKVYGSYRLACEAAQVKDEDEYVRAHAANCEVFWSPLTRTWM